MVTTSSVENHEVVEIPCGFEEFLMHLKKDLLISNLSLSNPFSISAEEVPQKYQMELIQLQCNCVFKFKFENVDIRTFYQYIGPTYPIIKGMALKTMSMFASTDFCTQLFSLMNLNKSQFRSQLTDMRISAQC